ncbi:hypothetical protein V6N13_130523 [Hibiscus sabdariffa]
MSSRGLKLAVPPEMQQNPCLELDNGDSSRNKGIFPSRGEHFYRARHNAVASQLPWVFPLVKRQLAQKSTCRLGQVHPLSFSSICPLVHQCCSITLLIILPGILQHLFFLSPCNCTPANHHQTTPFSSNTNPPQAKRLETNTHANNAN